MSNNHEDVEHSVGCMNVALRSRFERLRDLLSATDASEIHTRYRAGEIVADVKRSEAKYGTAAVAQLAEALGKDEATLYRYAKVAECWTAADIERIVARSGKPVSWSHVVELADVSPKKRRDALLERAHEEGLSVRALVALIRAENARISVPSQAIASELGRISGDAQRLVSRAERYEAVIDEIDALAKSGGAADLRKLLHRAAEAQRAAKQAAARLASRLESARSRVAPSSRTRYLTGAR